MTDQPFKTKTAVPTIHLNGTSKDELLNLYRNAHRALTDAQRAMAAATPHGRDYYVQSPAAYSVARHQHETRMRNLGEMIAEIETIAIAIQ